MNRGDGFEEYVTDAKKVVVAKPCSKDGCTNPSLSYHAYCGECIRAYKRERYRKSPIKGKAYNYSKAKQKSLLL